MNSLPEQSCCPARDDLYRLALNALPEEEARRLRQHVEECEACREALPDLGVTLRPSPPAFDRDPYADTGHFESPETPVPDAEDPAAEAASGPRFPFLSPPDNPEDLGRLGIYRIVGVLGEGGMGVVFDAIDTHLQRRVALKVMKPELAADLASRRRFLQEARAAAALPSDHIVPVYQVGMENDVPFLAMQYLPGESLEQRVRRPGPVPVAEAVRVGRETAAGLAAAHEGGLIHRDIKPANIWLEAGADGEPFKRVRLLDFGLARAVSGSSSLTASGMIVGTPSYLSPEQARGLQLDPRSDLFSLGCVFYRMLTGRLPFQGRDTMATLTALALNNPTPVEQLRPDVPPALARLVQQLLAKDPADRPASARAVIEQLDALDKEPPETAKVQVVPCHQRFALKDAFRLPPVRWALAAGALLFVLVLTGVLLGRKPGQPSPGQAPTTAGPAPAGEPIKLGVLFPLTGTLEASGSSVTEATLLAVDELNQQGGLLGRPVQAVVVDSLSGGKGIARPAEQLIAQERVSAVVGCWSSAGRKTARPVFEKYDHLLLYPVQYEGLEESPNIVYLGAAPNQQILPALQYAVGILRKRRLFLIGSDYVFPRTANEIIRGALRDDPEVEVVGEKYLALGSSEVREVVEAVVASRADLILNTINGDSNVAFFRALRAAGVTPERTPTLSFSIGETELRGLNARAMIGDYAAWNYFQSVDRPENAAFVQKFRARYGPQRVVSDPMESAYFGVHLWAQAVKAAGSSDPAAVRRALAGQSYAAPGGPVRIDPDNRHTWKVVRVGRIVEGGQFDIIWSSERPVRPEPFPASRPRAEWDRFLSDLHRKWDSHWEAPHE